MAPTTSRGVLLPLLLLACGPSPADTTTTTAATAAPTTTASTGHATDPTTTAPTTTMTPGTDTTVPADSSGPATTSDCPFICPPDLPPGDPGDHCDPFAQDCPEGQKCTVKDGFDDTHCVDVLPDPRGLGDTCTYTDHLLSGHDDCGFGLVCWEVDPETGIGTCHALCVGSADSPHCADPSLLCWPICQSCWFGICIGGCDPRLDDCPNDHLCLPESYTGDFICAIDASGDDGQYGDPCEWVNACDPGLSCAPMGAVPGCPPGKSCCAPYCDLNASTCPDLDLGVTCIPWYAEGDAPPGLEDLGLCSLPP